jgi:hypothetical protein
MVPAKLTCRRQAPGILTKAVPKLVPQSKNSARHCFLKLYVARCTSILPPLP